MNRDGELFRPTAGTVPSFIAYDTVAFYRDQAEQMAAASGVSGKRSIFRSAMPVIRILSVIRILANLEVASIIA